jgi:hypothetical protein
LIYHDISIKDGDFPVRYVNVYQRQILYPKLEVLNLLNPRLSKLTRFLRILGGGSYRARSQISNTSSDFVLMNLRQFDIE